MEFIDDSDHKFIISKPYTMMNGEYIMLDWNNNAIDTEQFIIEVPDFTFY